MPGSSHISLPSAESRLPTADGKRFIELYRHGSLAVELYAPRGDDPQQPHTRDEAYVVARGRGTFFDGERRVTFEPGDFLFVSAGRTHRFEDFSQDLSVWVFFYGPEGGEPASMG
ncbi:MAG: cupin domain-containing protein [Gemmatimonadota bacterium]